MKEIVFSSQKELYDRITPALKSKRKMLGKAGFKNIKESDIWDYMRTQKWVNSYGLELCDMVDDILNTKNSLIAEYYHNKLTLDNSVSFRNENDIDLPRLKN